MIVLLKAEKSPVKSYIFLYFEFEKNLATMSWNMVFSMAYYITWPDLLLVEFQLGMMHALLVLNILMMNLYYQLILCAKFLFLQEFVILSLYCDISLMLRRIITIFGKLIGDINNFHPA